MKRFLAVLVLTLTLSLTAFAGDIPSPGVIPDCTANQTCSNNTGDIPSPGAFSSPGEATVAASIDPVTDIVLSIVQGLLSLF
jgi:hypothetical protein